MSTRPTVDFLDQTPSKRAVSRRQPAGPSYYAQPKPSEHLAWFRDFRERHRNDAWGSAIAVANELANGSGDKAAASELLGFLQKQLVRSPMMSHIRDLRGVE